MKTTALITGCILAGVLCSTAGAADYSLSFASATVLQGERIIGFDITVKSAYLSAMRAVPPGWNIEIDNQPSGLAKVSGGIVVGAAAIDLTVLNKMFQMTSPSAAKDIVVSGEIITSKDFEHEHHMALTSSNVRVVH